MLLAALLACAAPPEAPVDPGNVVLRRLTREELDLTARDLLGTTQRPGRALPPDDFALGFDGLGEAQTFSALHLELWERGVDEVLDELFGAGELPSSTVVVEAESGEARATVGGVAEATAWVLWDEGSLVASFVPTVAGDYRLAATVWADEVGEGPARAALLVDGEVAADALVGDRGELAATVPLSAGVHELGVAVVAREPGDRDLVVDRLALTGPLGVDRPPSPSAGRVLVCDPAERGEPACAEEIVRTFARRAWRRPASPDEVRRLLGLYGVARGAGGDWEEGVRAALRGVLLSPWFLYKVELHDGAGERALSGFELATRLSYFLWSSAPDDRLLDLAQAGTLADPEVLEAEARRMLDDPRADGLVTALGGQWLGLRKVDEALPNAALFPAWDEGLRDGLRQELHDRIAAVFLGDRPLPDLLLETEARVDERVAAHYGVAPGALPAVVDLPERPGILGSGGLLAALALPDRTSPVARGSWVLGQLLCAPPPPPPAGIPPLDEDPEAPVSLRDQLEQHRADPACAACHDRMDAVGLALEAFDATGAYRTVDERGLPIDATGELDGRPFADAPGMAAVLAEDPAFVACAVRKTFTFALGRAPTEADEPVLAELEGELVARGLVFRELAVAVTRTRAFRYARPPGPPAQP